MKRNISFLMGMFIPALFMALIAIPNLIIFYQGHEFLSPQEIAKKMHNSEECLVGLASPRYKSFDYKKILYDIEAPDVISLGSSRAMQFRTTYFNENFLNMGGIVNNIKKFEEVSNEMLSRHIPKTIFLTLDFWWFHEDARIKVYEKNVGIQQRWTGTLQSIFLPLMWFFEGKINITQYYKLLNLKDNCHIGLTAIVRNEGFEHDGSYFYGDRYIKSRGGQFQQEIDRIKSSKREFKHGTHIQKEVFSKFLEVVKKWQDYGVDLYIIIAPVSPQVESYMKNYNYQFINKLYDNLLENFDKKYVYNFHSATKIDSPNCEFIDGTHLGDIANIRMLKKIYQNNPIDSINIKAINQALQTEENRTIHSANLDRYMHNKKEIDFLELGCLK